MEASDMMLEYEGTDITRNVVIRRCVYEAREEGRVPQLSVSFEDSRGLWDAWAPKAGDRVCASEKGAPATGAMYVRECRSVPGGYVLKADALPAPDEKATRIWRRTTLGVVVAQLAALMGLSAEFHGCEDMIFGYVRQDNEGALPVIARVCMVAGASFDIYDGTLHVCGRDWTEEQESAGVLELQTAPNYRRGEPYTCCVLHQAPDGSGREEMSARSGTAGKTLSVELDDRIGLLRTSEVERAAGGVLACANARIEGGNATAHKLSAFTPGSVCTVTCKQAKSMSGRAVVTRVRNDFARTCSKIWWRQI